MQRHQNNQNNFGKKEQSLIVTYPDFHLKVRDNATIRAPGPWVPSLGGCKMRLNAPHSLLYLNIWCPAGTSVWGPSGN